MHHTNHHHPAAPVHNTQQQQHHHHQTVPGATSSGIPGMSTPSAPGTAAVSQGPRGQATHDGPAPNTSGPHRYDFANKLDPTVDSKSGGIQVVGPGMQTSSLPPSAPPPAGTVAPTDTRAAMTPGVQPPHLGGVHPSSHHDAAPMAAPVAAQHQPPPVAGGYAPEGAYGPHGSWAANAADPRVDSDRDGRAAHHGHNATVQGGLHDKVPRGSTGPAPKTAGPHHSDIMNKLDPSVDSNPSTGRQRMH